MSTKLQWRLHETRALLHKSPMGGQKRKRFEGGGGGGTVWLEVFILDAEEEEERLDT